MKGQFFFLGSVIIVSGLLLLSSLFGFYNIIEENRHLSTLSIANKMWNIKRELSYSAGIGRINGVKDNYLRDFSLRLRNDTNIKLLYVLVTNNDTGFSVSFGNFLTNSLNTTLNNETNSIQFSLNDKEIRREHFSGDGISFSYTVLNVTTAETINFTGNVTKLFYDLEIFDNDYKMRVKETVVT